MTFDFIRKSVYIHVLTELIPALYRSLTEQWYLYGWLLIVNHAALSSKTEIKRMCYPTLPVNDHVITYGAANGAELHRK